MACALATVALFGCGSDGADVTVHNAKLLASMGSTSLAGKPSPSSWEWSQAARGKPVKGVNFETAANEMQASANEVVELFSAAIGRMKDGASRDIYFELLVAYKQKAAAVRSVNAAVRSRDDAALSRAVAEYRAALKKISGEMSKLTSLPGYEQYAQSLLTGQHSR